MAALWGPLGARAPPRGQRALRESLRRRPSLGGGLGDGTAPRGGVCASEPTFGRTCRDVHRVPGQSQIVQTGSAHTRSTAGPSGGQARVVTETARRHRSMGTQAGLGPQPCRTCHWWPSWTPLGLASVADVTMGSSRALCGHPPWALSLVPTPEALGDLRAHTGDSRMRGRRGVPRSPGCCSEPVRRGPGTFLRAPRGSRLPERGQLGMRWVPVGPGES